MRSCLPKCSFLSSLILSVVLGSISIHAQDGSNSSLPDSWSEKVRWRSVGPANMSGRITSIAVYPGDKNVWWASSASGGLLKTTNNGITFEHQFDDQATVSIGDVQVAATNPDLLWVGTGEANPRNSVSWGDGVYKSIDGGKTWKNMGLKKTFQTGRIAIHPENHDIVYVGSLGRLWGPNKERGLYKTADGGKNWEKVFYVDDKTGVIDVQMNPENPDELIIATYERMRDGFDGNDPVKKYGEGSAIYKTVDAGKTFTRLTNGLPTCKLGRIGLNYFKSNPNFIAAIVESEKIATEPKDVAYAGLRGEDADVGAKITEVTKDGPSEKAGLKADDIVVSVDGVVLHSYQDLLKEMRKHKAGETVKLVVSRERKPVDIALELAARPERPQRRGNNRRRGARRNPFTGTLGGQAANMQGQQGDNEEEYGGIYLSKDGGDSWERINTLNPRPMYYSQIRIDPVDMNHMYVLGTSLYRSKDAGKTFTGDGGRGGVHVDHHALWIDPDDPRHMILGNDGGLYVTYDRMDHWDHLNHIAIGQFYHVGVGPRLDYRVYGGLQDNGSWGGPVRAKNDSGTINSDWFRVGGGDGFITLVDPNDADQIYFESQNGAMGRIHLENGDRGFIRPRPPRGTRYRFNWKTPFLLSPHNSKIHYSAGNHVFRSYDKGNGIKSISPEITNSDRGAGSAITESPVQAGVLYVGTTDGAVWMTKDGGNEWVALYSKKEEKKPETNAEGEDAKPEVKEEKATSDNPEGEAKKAPGKLDGTWNGKMVSQRFPEGQEPAINLMLKSDADGNVSGEIETPRGPQEITSGKYNAESGELTIVIETQRGRREFNAEVKGDSMTGEMSMRGGQFQIEFEAKKQEDPGDGKLLFASVLNPHGLVSGIVIAKGAKDDPVSGEWEGMVRSDEIPNGEIGFTLVLEMDDKGALLGRIESPQGEFDIDEGQYTKKSKKVYFAGENDQVYLDFEAVLDGTKMKGDVTINDQMSAEFEATLKKPAEKKSEPAVEQEEAATEGAEEPAEMEEEAQEGEPGFLGVQLEPVDQSGEGAANVAMVVQGSGAEKAGIKAGDTIKSINGQEIENARGLLTVLRQSNAGETIKITITRDGEDQELEAKLGRRADAPRSTQRGERRRPNRPAADRPPADTDETQQSPSDETAASDAISGTWEGSLKSPQGDTSVTVKLKRTGDKITGTYETERSDGEIVEGKFNEETKALTLVAENERFNLEFDGQVSGSDYTGEIDFNGGMFSLEFEMKKTSGSNGEVAAAQEKPASEASGKTLDDLMPGPRWVSSLHASKYKAERCYISMDGHRSNDDLPYIFVTEDFGKSWNSVRGNLPDAAGSVRVIREDIKNENVLYIGCEFGAWVSIDRGKTWTKFKQLPTVAVHEIAQHPKVDDIIAATHGRSIWIADVSTLRQVSQESITERRKLYKPRDVITWRTGARRGSSGTRKFSATNEPVQCRIEYSLARDERSMEIEIRDLQGDVIKRFDDPPKSKGLNSVVWDLRRGNSTSRFGGPRISAGEYLVEMRVAGEKLNTTVSVVNDPNGPNSTTGIADEFTWWMYLGGLVEDID